MSANNFILIKKTYKKRWTIRECDADTGDTIFKVGWTDTLEEAIQAANEYAMTEEIEYGLDVRL